MLTTPNSRRHENGQTREFGFCYQYPVEYMIPKILKYITDVVDRKIQQYCSCNAGLLLQYRAKLP